jgi:hypothetical protein
MVQNWHNIQSHLRKDRKTWLRLSKKAKEEADSDASLIRKLRP